MLYTGQHFVNAKPLIGEVKIPGDKSITHRAMIISSIVDTHRQYKLHNWLQSYDCLATKQAMHSMGVEFSDDLIVNSVGLHGLIEPHSPLDVGNSGTTMRLLLGVLAAQKFDSTITGDTSLCARPMQRVIEPLTMMGAKISATAGNFAPLHVHGGNTLRPIDYETPVASAQVRSAIQLASLYAGHPSTISTSRVCRNHTELMLNNLSEVIYIPGDISSAAFFLVAASIVPGSDILLKDIGVNPTRTAVLDILQTMGAGIELHNQKIINGEPRANIRVRATKALLSFDLPPELIANCIDELPILCLAAACAKGTSVIRGAAELRVKESDRISLLVRGFDTLGIEVQEYPDGLTITGGKIGGGYVDTAGDHRIAMTFSLARLVAEHDIILQDTACIATSFPGFAELLEENICLI